MERYNTSNSNTFEVKDLSIASFLYAIDVVQFSGTHRLPSGEVFFQFTPKKKVQELISKYWNMEAPSVQPKKLFSAMRDLKDMIFGG